MILELVILGTVIGSNNLAVALALGAGGQKHRRPHVVAVFGVFEFLIPLLGILLGRRISTRVEAQASWIGPALLLLVGLWCIRGALRRLPVEGRVARHAMTWGGLVFLAAALSVDNLLIGISLGLAGTEPLLVAGTIAVFSTSFTWVGMGAGHAARRHWERYAQLGSGLLLIGLAAASRAGWI